MKSFFLDHQSKIEDLTLYGGGKATNLARLSQTGVAVPNWFCLSSQIFHHFLKKIGQQNFAKMKHQEIEDLFMSTPLEHELEEEIKKRILSHFPVNTSFAVRSSGIGEDSEENSFAGQFSSYLHQIVIEDILLSIKKCWASSFSDRANAYRLERGISTEKFGMGVVIQKMVFADIAGVGFSRDPIHPTKREQMIISSVYGLGEGLVSGELDADHYYVQRPRTPSDSIEYQPHIVKKDFYFI